MRAVVIESAGAEPACGEFPEPEVGAGEQKFELVGAGLHRVVRSLSAGTHYGSGEAFPLVPGVDAVARSEDGQLVYTGFVADPWGTMAERMVARFGLPLPTGADPLAVAAGMNPGMSGFMPLAMRAERGPLGTVLVLGATGTSGKMAVQSAVALGAQRVVAVGRNAAVLESLSGPAVVPVQLGPGALETLTELLDPAPSIVLDYLWGPVAELAFEALGRRGMGDDDADITYTQIGAMVGDRAAVPATLLRSRNIRLVGSGIGSMPVRDLIARLPRLMCLIADGTLTAPYREFSFEDAAAAWAWRGPERAVLVP